MIKKIVIRNGKKYIVNVPDWGESGELTNTGGPGGSLTFGATNQFLSVAQTNSSFAPGTGSYTVEWFQYQIAQPTNMRVFEIVAYPNTSLGVSIENFGGGIRLYLWENAVPQAVVTANSSSIVAPYLNQWDHYAVVRKSGSYVQIFRNGTAIKTITNSSYVTASITNSLAPLIIGGEGDNVATTMFSGNIVDFRFTKGYALYSQSYIVPTMPIGIGPGTTLLLLAQGSSAVATDLSGLNQTVTKNSVSWSVNSPF